MGEPKVSVLRAIAAQRQAKALTLRASGATFGQIADTLGYRSKSGAFKATLAGLHKTLREPAEELRVLELERLDRLQHALWPRGIAGDLRAVDRLLGIMERRAALLGLDAPKQIKLIEQEAERIADRYGLDRDKLVEMAERIALGLA